MVGQAPQGAVARRQAEAVRDDGREAQRDPVYQRPRARERRYDIETSMRRRGLDYFWGATKVLGQPNPRLREFMRAGWRVARARDYPEIAGLDMKIDRELIDLKIMEQPTADGPIIDSDLMLLVRETRLSEESRENDRHEARQQMDDKMRAMRAESERAIGNKTRMESRYTAGIPPEQVPDTSNDAR